MFAIISYVTWYHETAANISVNLIAGIILLFFVYSGFTSTQTCTLMNTALVGMTFRMRVLGDGVTESINSTSEYDSISSDNSGLPPKEFEVIPSGELMRFIIQKTFDFMSFVQITEKQ